MKTCNIRRLIIVVTLVGSTSALAGQDPTVRDGELCGFSEVSKAQGWVVPGLKGAIVKTRRAPVSGLSGIFSTSLKPGTAPWTTTLVRCSQSQKGRIEITEEPINVEEIGRFDIRGRPFLYRVLFTREVIERGKRLDVGASSGLCFYDPDGLGQFRVMRFDFFSPIASSLPDWVKHELEKRQPIKHTVGFHSAYGNSRIRAQMSAPVHLGM